MNTHSNIRIVKTILTLAALLVLNAACSPDEQRSPAPDSNDRHDSAPDLIATDMAPSEPADAAPDLTSSPDDLGATPDLAPPTMTCGTSLPAVHTIDAQQASRGEALLTREPFTPGNLPRLAMENLWLVWGSGRLTGAAYWEAFRERYGFIEAPFDNGGLPLGLRTASNAQLTIDCLACHGGEVAGEVILGAANSRLDLESLYEDLVKLNELAPMYGFPRVNIPYTLQGFTTAAGSMDAFGLAMRLASEQSGITLETEYGPQRAQAWWTSRYKQTLYADGIGQASGHRTMMATLLAFGTSPAQLQAMDDELEAISYFILATPTPCWELTPLDANEVARGRELFDQQCASCHGVHSGDAARFEDRVIALDEVGTDAMRASRWTEREAAAVNASWFGVPPMRETAGYVAPPLHGIWARAPYLHNGAVPDLASLLDPALRPLRWRRTGSGRDDYDAARVGWRYEVVDAPTEASTQQGRRVVDTTRAGLSGAGHTYGASLDASSREALLEYLRSL